MTAVSFATMVNEKILIPSPRTPYVAVKREHLVDFMKPVLREIHVDSEWYLLTNPDIADAIKRGDVKNPEDHYVTFGYYEHRMPYEIHVEETWYLTEYSDVSDAVAKGLFGSARDHFYAAGFKEGRLPQPGFAFRTAKLSNGASIRHDEWAKAS